MRPKANHPTPERSISRVSYCSERRSQSLLCRLVRTLAHQRILCPYLVLEAGRRSEGREAGIIRVSERVLETAMVVRFSTGHRELRIGTQTRIVEYTDAARRRLWETRRAAMQNTPRPKIAPMRSADRLGTRYGTDDQAGLIYAISENPRGARIDVGLSIGRPGS